MEAEKIQREGNTFAERLQYLLDCEGVTAEDYADMLGKPYKVLKQWLSGSFIPKEHTLNKIAKDFAVTVDYLLAKPGAKKDDWINAHPEYRKKQSAVETAPKPAPAAPVKSQPAATKAEGKKNEAANNTAPSVTTAVKTQLPPAAKQTEQPKKPESPSKALTSAMASLTETAKQCAQPITSSKEERMRAQRELEEKKKRDEALQQANSQRIAEERKEKKEKEKKAIMSNAWLDESKQQERSAVEDNPQKSVALPDLIQDFDFDDVPTTTAEPTVTPVPVNADEARDKEVYDELIRSVKDPLHIRTMMEFGSLSLTNYEENPAGKFHKKTYVKNLFFNAGQRSRIARKIKEDSDQGILEGMGIRVVSYRMPKPYENTRFQYGAEIILERIGASDPQENLSANISPVATAATTAVIADPTYEPAPVAARKEEPAGKNEPKQAEASANKEKDAISEKARELAKMTLLALGRTHFPTTEDYARCGKWLSEGFNKSVIKMAVCDAQENGAAETISSNGKKVAATKIIDSVLQEYRDHKVHTAGEVKEYREKRDSAAAEEGKTDMTNPQRASVTEEKPQQQPVAAAQPQGVQGDSKAEGGKTEEKSAQFYIDLAGKAKKNPALKSLAVKMMSGQTADFYERLAEYAADNSALEDLLISAMSSI